MRVSVSVRVVQFQFLCFACCIIMSELLDSMMTTMVNTIKNEKQKKKKHPEIHTCGVKYIVKKITNITDDQTRLIPITWDWGRGNLNLD
jgi:hypothetical protein